MRQTLLIVLGLLSCTIPRSEAQPVITEDAKLVGSDTDFRATAGWAIAAAEDFVVVGAFGDNSTSTTGAAYVFRETAGGWEEEAKLSASEESFFTFGFSVDAWSDGREDVVIVGAQGDSFQPETDAAYVFRRSASAEWVEEARLTNSLEEYEFFGRAVAIHGDYAVAGAPGANDAGETTGAAYVFRRTNDDGWVEEARLLASDASAPAGFGRGVAISVSDEGVPFVVIGAPSDDAQRGAAYTFRRTSEGTWVEEAKLVAPDFDPGALLGIGVAITETPDGTIIALAGELGDRDNGIQTGAGYVFRREGDGSWVFEEKLTAADGQSGQRLGWSAALAAAPEIGGTVAVLGADGAYNFAGTVRLFRRTVGEVGPVWIEEAELWASDRAPNDRIGYSVGASGRYAVAGAPFDSDEGGPLERGAGYVWDLRRAVPAEPAPLTDTDHVELIAYPNPAVGGSVSLRIRSPRFAHVRIDVYDALGRRVDTLLDRRLAAGETIVPFDPAWGAGTYFLHLRTDTETFTASLTLIE
jgi:hypothetical protein